MTNDDESELTRFRHGEPVSDYPDYVHHREPYCKNGVHVFVTTTTTTGPIDKDLREGMPCDCGQTTYKRIENYAFEKDTLRADLARVTAERDTYRRRCLALVAQLRKVRISRRVSQKVMHLAVRNVRTLSVTGDEIRTERDRLAMQLEAAQAALTETMQANTAHAEEAEAGRAVLRRVFEMVSALEHPSDILDVLDAALHPEPPHA